MILADAGVHDGPINAVVGLVICAALFGLMWVTRRWWM